MMNKCTLFLKTSSLSVLAYFMFFCSSLSAQMKAIKAIPLNDRHLNEGQYPIVLGSDSNGVFYLDYVSEDTLMLKRQSETTSQNHFAVLKDFDLKNGLKHCIVKKNDRIYLLNRANNSIQCFNFKGTENLNQCTKLSEYKVEFEDTEKLIRIEIDNKNVYLVSYNLNSRCQKFYLLNAENNAIKLLYSKFNPFIEIFFTDDNVSNYSFFNNKLAVTDFYIGNTVIVNLSNSHVDSVKAPFTLCENQPSYGTFERLSNKYDDKPNFVNYENLMNLVYQYNRIINSFFLNDSTLLIAVRFKDLNSAPFDIIGVNLSSQNAIFKQHRINAKSASEIVKLSNMPIYLGFEESNYIGDGVIYVYKKMPELNQYDLKGFLNTMEQYDGPKVGTFIFYKMDTKTK